MHFSLLMRENKPLHLIFFICIFVALFFSDARAGSRSYFSTMNDKRADDLSMFPKWNSVRTRYDEKKDTPDDQCGTIEYYPCEVKEWKKLLSDTQSKPLREKLDIVNDWANEHPYIIDQINWGVEDYWETPFEFMTVNGDCEDYAIAKYYSLRALGVPEDHLRIIIVQDFNLGGIIHAILGVYDDNELLILDNQIKQVMPARKIYHYRPIYGINSERWWEYTPR
jgi:predicted transglutaminase-like cysteine proteinase